MGASCGGKKPEEGTIILNLKNIIRINKNILIIKKYNKPINIPKITLIQSNYRTHLCIKKLKNLIETQKKKLLIYCDKKKLINIQVLKKCKSEKYYQKLLSTKKIKPFLEQYINNNYLLSKQFSIISKNSILIPYAVVTSNTQVYIGSFNLNKKFQGYGIIYDFDDDKNKDSRTEGIFTNGELNGLGRVILSSNEILSGDFLLNKLNGFGEYLRNDNSKYIGTFFNGLPQGNGKEIFNDGSFFEGFYIKGKKKNGKFVFKNGNFYQGNFENELYDGEGIYKWKDGKIYEGFWKKGKIHGKGKLSFIDGSFYDGYFNEGKKEGKGKYFWGVSNYYEGEWKNDKQDGFGLYYKNGKKARGYWSNGKLVNDCCVSQRNKVSNKYLLNGRFNKNFMQKNFNYGISFIDKIDINSNNKNNDNYDEESFNDFKKEKNPQMYKSNNYYMGEIKPINKKIFDSMNSIIYQSNDVECLDSIVSNKNKDKEETKGIK